MELIMNSPLYFITNVRESLDVWVKFPILSFCKFYTFQSLLNPKFMLLSGWFARMYVSVFAPITNVTLKQIRSRRPNLAL